jgi:nucleotide-binding universal stress UspA family protein
MVPVSKILVPVDFSERAFSAVRYARNLACHFHAELTLLHVLPPIPYAMGGFEFGGVVMTDAFADRLPEARSEMDEFLASELIGMNVTRLVLEGDPAQTIVEHAHGCGVDLIVIPTHGYGPFRRFLLGSVTAKVLHDADCPVLTGVHLEEGPILEATAPRKILCAVDLGPQSEKVVRWADQMAQEFQGEMVVVHAMPLGETHSEEMFDPEWRVALEERVREKLSDLMAGVSTKATIVTESGNPAEVAHSAAQRFNSDLAVIGRSEAAGMFGRLRTNAYSIIRQSPCPVVSV